jgi:hypothetical protein
MQVVTYAHDIYEDDAVSKMLHRIVTKAQIKTFSKTRFADDRTRSYLKRRCLDMHKVKSAIENINFGVRYVE